MSKALTSQRTPKRRATHLECGNLLPLSESADKSAPSKFWLLRLSSGVQVIEIQDRVEDQEVAARSLAPPEGIWREEHDVPFIEWGVDHGGVLRDVVAPVEQSGNQQIARLTISQHYTRSLAGRNQTNQVATLL